MKLLSFVFTMLAGLAIAQTSEAKAELKRICKAFETKPVWSTVKVTAFKKAADKKGDALGNGEFILKPGTGYYSNFNGEMCVADENETVFADRNSKSARIIKQGMKIGQNKMIPDTSVFEVAKFEITRVSDTQNKIEITLSETGLTRTEIYYNSETGMLSRVVYYYASTKEEDFGAEKIEIEYSYKDSSLIPANKLNVRNYVRKKLNGTYEPADALKGYYLLVA